MERRRDPERWRLWSRYAALGPVFAGAVVIGYFFGRALDGLLATAPWLTLVGIGLGTAAGMREVLRAVKLAERERGGRPVVRGGRGASAGGRAEAGGRQDPEAAAEPPGPTRSGR
ncbi:MAG: hypothetical protein KatS3mg102_1500 [Planctomycetota bacterium]|nr:MAG: hypothetical protein KatS3mg102_1500 [Planctomycetota bacterium]